MNKVLSALLVVALMFASVSVAKASNDTVVGITYYDDDSYVITTINYAVTKSSSTVSGSKTSTYYRSDGIKAFSLTVYGTFSYDGKEAKILKAGTDSNISKISTNASYSHYIYQNDWSLKSASATKSGNTATATGTFIRKELGITVDTKTRTVNLSCDRNGNLS